MSRYVNGRDVLRNIDRSIAGLRRQLNDAISALDSMDLREADIRDRQAVCFASLADLRLDLVRSEDDPDELDRAHRKARDLLDRHEAFVLEQEDQLENLSDELGKLETLRGECSERHERAIQAYEDKVAEVETRLLEDARYLALKETAEKRADIASRAHQKLELAREDFQKKGQPYRDDPLFTYLWERGFRTPDYKAPPHIRFLDHWVGRLCKYDKAYLNYGRLSDLPEWLEAHATAQDKAAEDALLKLEAEEESALNEAGADVLRQSTDNLLQEVQSIDADIDAAETRHLDLAKEILKLRENEEGPALQARELLEKALANSSFPDLRVLAAETVALNDDHIVDELVTLRREELALEIEADKLEERPITLRQSLSESEQARRDFKSARYDSAYATFDAAIVGDVLASLATGELASRDAMRRLKRTIRRREPKAHPGFGGRRRSRTSGLPNVLGDVAWEIAKEGMRQGRRGGYSGFPTSGRGFPKSRKPRIKIPRSRGSRRSGGFRTGGGF